MELSIDLQVLKVIVFCLLGFNFLSFALTVRTTFRSYKDFKKLPYFLLIFLCPLTWNIIFFEFYYSKNLSFRTLGLLLVLQIFFGTLFWWAAHFARKNGLTAAFSLDTPEVLVNKGPYQYLRHPCYTAYLGSYFSVAILILGPFSLIMSCIMFALYLMAAKLEESKFLGSPLAEEYRTYQKETWMFLPF